MTRNKRLVTIADPGEDLEFFSNSFVSTHREHDSTYRTVNGDKTQLDLIRMRTKASWLKQSNAEKITV